MAASESRPGALSAAFWLLVVGAVLLMFGGLLTATVGIDTLRQAAGSSVPDATFRSVLLMIRGAGIVFGIAGAALAWLAARTRAGDPRFRRAAMGLGSAIVVLVGLTSVFGRIHIFALLSLLPIIVGVLLLNRPAVLMWFAAGAHEGQSSEPDV